MKRNLLIVLSGPAGSGKTTLCANTMKCDPKFDRVITATTRAPRTGEVDGKDYIFLSQQEFLNKLQNGEFYEHATVHGRMYGTLKSSIQKAFANNKDLFLVIDVQGAKTWREIAKKDPLIGNSLLSVFIMPKSIDELVSRLHNRNTDDEAEIALRMKTAQEELKYAKDFDKILTSGTREEDLKSLQEIIAQARQS